MIDFIETCVHAVTREPQQVHMTTPRLSLLQLQINKPRSIFLLDLPPPFSLLENLETSFSGGSPLNAVDRDTILNIPFLRVPGYCRNQEVCSGNEYIAILPGCSVPLLLRHIQGQTMRIISDAYVYGLMGGEALEKLPRQKVIFI